MTWGFIYRVQFLCDFSGVVSGSVHRWKIEVSHHVFLPMVILIRKSGDSMA